MKVSFPWFQSLIGTTRWRWGPGSLSLLVVLGCINVGAFQSSEYLAFNTLHRIRGPQPWHDDIVVIEIDEQTLKILGGFPLSRRYYAQVLDFLRESQSGVVVFDVVFPEPSPDDSRLAQSMLYHGQVVLAQAWNQSGMPTLPTKTLTDNAIHSGHVLNYPDSDGITRSIHPYVQGIPALGVAAIQAYSLTTDLVPMPEGDHLLWINWPSSNDGLEKYSFLDVLQRNVESDRFQNKLVIIGSSVSGIDPIATPFNQAPPATGIDLQAAVISNLLYGNNLRLLFPPYQTVLLLIGGPMLSLYLSRCNLLRRWILGVVLGVGWLGLGFLLLKLNVWIPMVWPITLIVLGVSFTEISTRLKASAILQEEVERLWQTYRRDVLVQAVGAHPFSLQHNSPLWNGASNDSGQTGSPNADPTYLPLSGWTEEQWGAPSSANLGQGAWMEPSSLRHFHQLTTLVDVFGRSQALHGAIARSLTIGLVATDWDGQVWFCNPAATEFLGITIGHSLVNTLIPQWLNQGSWERYLRNLQQGQTIRWEIFQSDRWFEISLEPLSQSPNVPKAPLKKQAPHPTSCIHLPSASHHDALKHSSQQTAEDLIGLLLLVEDITTYKQVEDEIRKALAQEKEFNELKSRFVSMVSHELRTPLTIIRTSIEMLERRDRKGLTYPLSSETFRSDAHVYKSTPHQSTQSIQSTSLEHNPVQQKYFQRIDNAVSAMTHLLEDVLLLGKVATRKLEFKPQYLDCVQLCHTIVEEMQVQPLGYPRIVFKSQGDVRQRYIDAGLLKMILSNLLSNAIKYSADHTFIYVDVDCRPDTVVLQVEDQGIGIPSETQQQLFKEFHRATNVGSVPGTGLGLSIVKQCVDLHKGKIIVESALDVGSTFIVNLPS